MLFNREDKMILVCKKISFLFLFILLFSCHREKKYQALKEGYYVNEYALDLIKSKKMQITRMPYLIPEFHFNKDTVIFFAGYDKMTASYTRENNNYILKDINDHTEYSLTITSDSTFVLNHNFYKNDDPSFNYTEDKNSYSFKESPYNFTQCLNELVIAGNYEITFPTLLAGKRIRFNSNGTIENFVTFKKYEIPYSGDHAQMLDSELNENSIFLESNTGYTLFAWKYDPNKKDITLFSTTPPIPDIKGEQKVVSKVFQLKRIAN